MDEIIRTDICVIGGGSGRQNVSAEAVQMGDFLNHYSAQFPPEKSIVEGLVWYVLLNIYNGDYIQTYQLIYLSRRFEITWQTKKMIEGRMKKYNNNRVLL